MSNIPVWLYILAVICSGIIGVIVTLIVQQLRWNRQIKHALLIQFVENRFDLQSDEFSRALNKIYIVFGKNEEVISALSNFHEGITYLKVNKHEANNRLLILYKAMCKDLKINPMEETFFLIPFNPREVSKEVI